MTVVADPAIAGPATHSPTTPTYATDWLQFVLTPELEAADPPEHRPGAAGRGDVRLLVSVGEDEPVHARFSDLPSYLDPGDLLVVNNSATLPASVDGVTDRGEPVEVHLSTALPSGLWLVELRRPVDVWSATAAGEGGSPLRESAAGEGGSPLRESAAGEGGSPLRESAAGEGGSPLRVSARAASRPRFADATGHRIALPGGASVDIVARYRGSHRLWLAVLDLGDRSLVAYLGANGRAIRYGHVPRDWPIDAYQTVFAVEPGSAEMPSAARAITAPLVAALVARGIGITPITLHTGVSSLEGHEQPYPERVRVAPSTAERVNAARASGARVVAVGTTVVRALEAAADEHGTVGPLDRWTDVVITPERGVRAVDGLLTGWHEPEASHLLMLEAIAGRPALASAYRAAVEAGYHWHEFGDAHLILPTRGHR
jgi:S-adenosylmethionine:tRNA ribosyltransferase-isomerase